MVVKLSGGAVEEFSWSFFLGWQGLRFFQGGGLKFFSKGVEIFPNCLRLV